VEMGKQVSDLSPQLSLLTFMGQDTERIEVRK
jgi:hypothetical protein